MPTRATFIGSSSAAVLGFVAMKAADAAAPPAGGSVAPEQLVQRLVDGNKRFVDGTMIHEGTHVERREALTESQAPYCAVVSCADSRVPTEIVFDQTVGDLFVTRVAGNYAPDDILGSLEYAVEHLGTRLILVLGHESCGAVKAVYDAAKSHTELPSHLDVIQRALAPAIAPLAERNASLDEAIRANVRAVVERIKTADPTIAPAVRKGDVYVTGAVYHLGTGKVEFLSRGA